MILGSLRTPPRVPRDPLHPAARVGPQASPAPGATSGSPRACPRRAQEAPLSVPTPDSHGEVWRALLGVARAPSAVTAVVVPLPETAS